MSVRPGVLPGRVELDRRPVQGAKVYAIDPDGPSMAGVAVTDAAGRYVIGGVLTNTRYHVVATWQGTDGYWYASRADPKRMAVAVVSDVHSVIVSPATLPLAIGATGQLQAVARNAGGNALTDRTISWHSLTPSVITVSSSGVVTAVAAGTAVVRAMCEGVMGTATVTVVFVPVPTSIVVDPASVTLTIDPTPRPTSIVVTPASVTLTIDTTPRPTSIVVDPASVTLTIDPTLRPTSIVVTPASVTLTIESEPDPLVPTTIVVEPATVELTLES